MAITPKDAAERAARTAEFIADMKAKTTNMMASGQEPYIDSLLSAQNRVVARSQPSPDAITLFVLPEVFAELARRYTVAGWSANFDGTTLTIEPPSAR